jgi:pantetheine-phosphate adenylyltransferase
MAFSSSSFIIHLFLEFKMKAIFAGSFDPPTNGHLDLIQRAYKFCDELIVAIGVNSSKAALFSRNERISLLKECINVKIKNPNKVSVDHYSGLLIDYAQSQNCNLLIRGARNVMDFEYEYNLAQVNTIISDYPAVDTIILPADPDLSIISSSMIKELSKYKKSVSKYVPICVQVALEEKFKS